MGNEYINKSVTFACAHELFGLNYFQFRFSLFSLTEYY